MSHVPSDFYLGEYACGIARSLLGKKLCVDLGSEGCCSGRIVETEAYIAPDDDASHAYNFRKTPRNTSMYDEGGVSYVYIAYGIHTMFNVVTAPLGVPHAILIRALEPIEGIDMMRMRRGLEDVRNLCSGPGKLCQALGITKKHDNLRLYESSVVWIEEGGLADEETIQSSRRVGLNRNLKSFYYPWRYFISFSPYVSRLV